MRRAAADQGGTGIRFRSAQALDRRGSRGEAWAVLLSAVLLVAVPQAQAESAPPPRVSRGAVATEPVTPVSLDVDLSKLAVKSAWRRGNAIRFVPKQFHAHPKLLHYLSNLPSRKSGVDPLLALQEAAPTRRVFTTPTLNFGGQGFSGVYPPDTVGAVGANYYIQAINGSPNTTYTIYNKATGALAAGPISFGSLFSNPGNLCATSGGGDPILLYDEQASRWLISEFTSPFSGNYFCVYISKTSDPISGGWWSYRFEAQQFPDYPKYGVWPDAYFIGTNESAGPRVYAMDRTAMLAGAAATMQFKNLSPSLAAFGFQMATPATQDGATPPPTGSPGIFIRHRDDEAHNVGSNDPSEDYLDIFELEVDFANSSNTTLTGPVSLAIAEFDSELCGFSSFSCIDQPSGSAPGLDPLREVVMWRLQYRNTGSFEKLVGNHTTDVNGADRAGVRWWELRRSGGGAWALEQEGTYAPNGDSDSRWMGSVSSDASGNIAVGYSVGSSSLSAGIRYSGRLSGDPAGTLTQAETTVQSGTGSQNFDRWGDYSAMTVDPSDGCTFWYTNEYALGNGTWSTRVASFKFDTCGEPGFTFTGSNLVQSVCAASLSAIPLSVNSVGGFTDPVTLSFVGIPAGFSGSFSTNPVTPGGSSTASVAVDPGQVTAGLKDFLIRASAAGASDQDVAVDVTVFTSGPGIPQLASPAEGFTTLSNTPKLIWGFDGAVKDYVVEVDDDPGFGSIDYTASVGAVTSHIIASALNPDTTYSWRVRASNTCNAVGVTSTAFQFTTPETVCRTPGLSIPDGFGNVSDTLVVGSGDPIGALETSVKITHTYVGDLSVTLEHVDTGTSVLLIDRPGEPFLGLFGCQHSDMDVILSDVGSGLVENQCEVTSPSISGIRIPNNPLAAFSGESIAGTWELTVSDAAAQDTGTLDEWCLLVVPEPGSATMLGSGILLLWLERRMRGRRSRSAR